MRTLELLAPARNADIGIAAINCGADAVYMAGPAFGARKDAANGIEDVARVCRHAHLFGAKVFLTVNTIIYEKELDEVHALMLSAQEAGVDAFIVQDLSLTTFSDITVPLHASTQCAIRTPQKAKELSALGFSRLVPERELSLEQIRSIRAATEAEIEVFVHGALCVCYSGQCYLSEYLSGRSANRGECIQACRSLYDLVDGDWHVLGRDRAFLSLRDLNLLRRLEDLAEAGADSFKIEGRLKNASYVKNIVSAYSQALDALVAAHPYQYRRASFGRSEIPFTPSPERTFNRGYTELYIDGRRDKWSSMDTPKSVGEYIGTVESVRPTPGRPAGTEIRIRPADRNLVLSNGDGFTVTGREITGFRGDICEGRTIISKPVRGIRPGDRIYRNLSATFERELSRDVRRSLAVELDVNVTGSFDICLVATSEDGRTVSSSFKADVEAANDRDRQQALITGQLSKRSGQYDFRVRTVTGVTLPLLGAATLNAMRRCVASDLDALPVKPLPSYRGAKTTAVTLTPPTYKDNIANTRAAGVAGGENAEPAYELSHRKGVELMRTKYCLRYELNLCPVHQGAHPPRELFLLNNGRRLALGFDCSACEMTVSEA